MFRTSGLRVSELVRIDLADWHRRENSIQFLPATRTLLVAWLEVRGEQPGRLFHGEHRPVGVAMHTHAIRHMLATRCRAAGIERFGTHDFRRTFATEMLRRYDAALVSRLLNHRKLASTLCCDMATDEQMRSAIAP